jgi:biotin carboxyl carrier protein
MEKYMSSIVLLPSKKNIAYEVIEKNNDKIKVKINDNIYSFDLIKREGQSFILRNGEGETFVTSSGLLADQSLMIVGGGSEIVVQSDKKRKTKNQEAEGSLISPMPGKIFKVLKKVTDKVIKGETILILEAMKMEHSIKADKDGVIKKIYFNLGDQVQGQVVLAEIDS